MLPYLCSKRYRCSCNKNVHDKAAFYNVDIIDSYRSEELSMALGVESRKVIGVLDEGLAKILKK